MIPLFVWIPLLECLVITAGETEEIEGTRNTMRFVILNIVAHSIILISNFMNI